MNENEKSKKCILRELSNSRPIGNLETPKKDKSKRKIQRRGIINIKILDRKEEASNRNSKNKSRELKKDWKLRRNIKSYRMMVIDNITNE